MRDIDSAMDKARKQIEIEESSIKSKGDYERLTITVPSDLYDKLIDEVAKRRKAKTAKGGFSGVVRDALIKFLD